MISFISSIETINSVLTDPNILLWVAPSVADAAVANPDGIKTFLAYGLSIYPIKDNPIFSNGSKGLQKILLIVLFYLTEFLFLFLFYYHLHFHLDLDFL